ncbi:hypothetical protein [Sorangium cellulosum]|uniref:Uncharacterized protein n=1 Tax=Sorangium cellulosum So0157-2 TaxID=1254432 RepID=S4Y0J6_SORCE|nr:hypothetical protein [Sorangium cellulosum]AGP38992.1 hypothetical protein SCE1572_33590 [Sorangium cellulosum So0157-2]
MSDDADKRSSSGGAAPDGGAAGPRDENSVVISLSALLAVEAAAAKPAGARADQGPKGSGMVDIQGLAAGDEQQRSSYLDLFPFGAPELPAFRSPDLTPVPSEVPIDLRPPLARRAAGVRYGVMGLAGAAVVASAVWLGAPREALRAAAQPGVRSAASAALSRLPKVEAKARAESAAATSPKRGDKANERTARGAKARPAAPGGAGKAAARRAESSGPAGGAAPPSQGGARAASDPCKGDLDCAMRRAAGGS